MRRVADVCGQEVMQSRRDAAGNDAGEPCGDNGEHDGDRPEPEPDEVRDRKQEPEEDGQPRAAEIVSDGQLNRVAGHGPESTMRARCH